MPIDSGDGVLSRATASVAYFDKDETVAVEHDQIDFATSAMVVARNRSKARALESFECEILGVVAAQSSSGSNHVSPLASSGGSNSPCSLMS